MLLLTMLVMGFGRASAPKLDFEYVEILEIENQILANDNLFILFFNQRDGATEEVHRDFLKAAALLSADKIDVKILECNDKLSTRMEDLLHVYKYPKFKFFQHGKPSQTYNGGQKIPHIVAWVKKMLRQKKSESTEIVGYDDFIQILSSHEIKESIFFYGFKDSEQFTIYEKVAETRVVKFYWTSNTLVWKILEFMVENSIFNPNKHPLYDEEVHKTKDLYEQRIFQSIKLEDETTTLTLNKLFFVRKVKFASEEVYITDSLVSYDSISLKSFIKGKLYQIIENVHALKQTIEAKTSEEEHLYFAFLYNKPAFYAIKQHLKEIIKNFASKYTLAFVDLEAGNGYIYLEIFKYDKDSIFILQQKKNENIFHKYKVDVNFNHFFVDIAKEFSNSFTSNQLVEYVKSRPVESVTYKDPLFSEAVGSNYESLVYDSYQSVLTIFYQQDDGKLATLVNFVKKYEDLFFHFKFLRINVADNEVKDNLKGKNFPFVKIYYGKNKTLTKGISFTPDENAFSAFIKEIVTSDEL
jgi:hypothetical protein